MAENVCRLLLVEDMPNTRLALTRLFSSPPERLVEAYHPPKFDLTVKTNAHDAIGAVHCAVAKKQSFDVCVVDLQLPQTEDDDTQSVDVGIQLLSDIHALEDENVGLLVNSVHPRFEQLARLSLVDFVYKDHKHLEARLFAGAVGLWHRVMSRRRADWATHMQLHCLECRIGIGIQQLATSATDFVNHPLLALTADLQTLASEESKTQHGIAFDGVLGRCRNVGSALETWIRKIGDRYSPLQGLETSGHSTERFVEAELINARCGINLHRVTIQVEIEPRCEEAPVEKGLQILFREWLLGAVDTGTCRKLTIRVCMDDETDRCLWILEDDSEAIASATWEKILQEQFYNPEDGRLWGLSLIAFFGRTSGIDVIPEAGVDGTNRLKLAVSYGVPV